MGYRHVNFTDEDRVRIAELREQGQSFRKIGKEFGVCADTVIDVYNGVWHPKAVKLPVQDEALYMDWLMLGSYTAVAQKYGATDKPVRQRVYRYCAAQGITL